MPHLSGYCTCGREKHYPKNARAGTTWQCWNCGEIWMIVPRGSGKKLSKQSSRPPAPRPQPQVLILPVLREVIRDVTPNQLPAPAKTPPQPQGCAPAMLGMIGAGSAIGWWLIQLA